MGRMQTRLLLQLTRKIRLSTEWASAGASMNQFQMPD